MKKVNLKPTLQYIPEASVLLMAIYWFTDNLLAAPASVNYVMLAIVAFVSVLVIFRSKILAVILAAILGLGSLYMLLAVFAEFAEFPPGDPKGIELLVIGSLIFLGLASMSVVMPFKYFARKS